MKTVTRDRVQFRPAKATFLTRRYAVLFTGACLLTLAFSTYGKSRVSQCNRLVAIVNEAADAQSVPQGISIADDNRNLLHTAIELDRYADKLEMLEFSNQQIQDFQMQFINLYRDTSRASNAVVTAPVNKFEVVRQVNRTFIETQEREGPLVQAVNQYCRGDSQGE